MASGSVVDTAATANNGPDAAGKLGAPVDAVLSEGGLCLAVVLPAVPGFVRIETQKA